MKVSKMERRMLCPELVQLRSEMENERPVLTGYAVRWNSLSVEMDEGNGPFYERVLQGAFTESLQTTDVWALGYHDDTIVLGRLSAGTLRGVEDDAGFRVLIYTPESPNGQNVAVAVARGDVDSMSFGFVPVEEREVVENGVRIREIVKADLHEVSVVVWPAYEESSIQVRSYRNEPLPQKKRIDPTVLRLRQRNEELRRRD